MFDTWHPTCPSWPVVGQRHRAQLVAVEGRRRAVGAAAAEPLPGDAGGGLLLLLRFLLFPRAVRPLHLVLDRRDLGLRRDPAEVDALALPLLEQHRRPRGAREPNVTLEQGAHLVLALLVELAGGDELVVQPQLQPRARIVHVDDPAAHAGTEVPPEVAD